MPLDFVKPNLYMEVQLHVNHGSSIDKHTVPSLESPSG